MDNLPDGFSLPEGFPQNGSLEFEDSDYDSDPDDPIIASYDVYLKPQIADGRKIYILQFPNRDMHEPYTAANHCQPTELRIKPESGMVELDVPIDYKHNYDRQKGIKWGGAMKKSDHARGVGAHGLPAGFGIGGAQSKGKGQTADAEREEIEKKLRDFDGAVEQGEALAKQTLGGQIARREEHSPQYMIGTFREDQLHLTPVDAMVQMRPQFHHLDAYSEMDKSRNAKTTLPTRGPEARSVHMTVKNPIDGEEDTKYNMADRISDTQREEWRRHKYSDEDADKSWAAYRHLFVGQGSETGEQLKLKMPKLKSAWTDEEYLDEISAPLDAARLSRAKMSRKGRQNGKDVVVLDADMDVDSSSEDDGGQAQSLLTVTAGGNDLYDA